LAISVAARADVAGYTFDVTTTYQGGCGPGIDLGLCGGPDTGFLTLKNNGSTSFSGTITLSGVAPGQTINLVDVAGLGSGVQVVFGAGPESSNMGGFNKVGGGSPDNGLKLEINGTVTNGAITELVDLIVFDKDIHSGVSRTNPFGVILDNYVLQGGDPFGRDTTDGYEETQADGHFEFFESPGTPAVPEPASLFLFGTGLAVCLGILRRRTS
jgi:hypothetical protein